MSRKEHPGEPMPMAHAAHLLNPLRALILSPRTLARRLDLKPDSSVLEIGPGPGYFSPAIARAVPQGELILMDVQDEMLDMAKKRLTGHANVIYQQGDASSIPLPDASLDVVFLVSVLGEIPDQEFLSEGNSSNPGFRRAFINNGNAPF